MTLQSVMTGAWQRMADPILSAATAGQPWCRVILYNPSVIKADGLYRMWFVGCCTRSRATDHCLGYAESQDGLSWKPFAGSPVATTAQASTAPSGWRCCLWMGGIDAEHLYP